MQRRSFLKPVCEVPAPDHARQELSRKTLTDSVTAKSTTCDAMSALADALQTADGAPPPVKEKGHPQ